MTRSIVKVLYKKGDAEDLGNYRGISLLNIDTKIFSTAIAARLAEVCPDLIHPNQIGFMADRFIGEIPITIQGVHELAKKSKVSIGCLQADQEKAFDRCSHDFLFKVMDRFNFGAEFIALIHLLYDNARSCVLINGYLGDDFLVLRGVRQGFPASCLLFNLFIKPFSAMLRAELKGITIGKHTFMQSLTALFYADDTNVFFMRSERKALLQCLQMYEKATGMRFNAEKTRVVWLGKHSELPLGKYKALKAHETIDAVGITIGPAATPKAFWDKKLAKLHSKMPLTYATNAKCHARAMLANSLVLSGIWYYAHCGVQVPAANVKTINKTVFKYIWRGKKKGKVERKICWNRRRAGGLGLIPIPEMVRALAFTWLRRFTDPSTRPWKEWFSYHLHRATGKWKLGLGILDESAKLIPVKQQTPYLIKSILRTHRELDGTIDYSKPHPCQPRIFNLFFNSQSWGGALTGYQWLPWVQAGYTTVIDFFLNDKLLTFEQISKKCTGFDKADKRRFEFPYATLPQYRLIVMSIQKKWYPDCEPLTGPGSYVIHKAQSGDMYEIAIIVETIKKSFKLKECFMDWHCEVHEGTDTYMKQTRFCQVPIIDEVVCISKHKEPGPGKLPRPYYFGLAQYTAITWDQVIYTPTIKDAVANAGQLARPRDKFSLYQYTVKRGRNALAPYTPSKGPASWHEEIGAPNNDNTLLYWQPNFKKIEQWPFHEVSKTLMFKILHHAYESADRLGDYVTTDKCHCGEVETISHIFSKCHIINKAWNIIDAYWVELYDDHLDPCLFPRTAGFNELNYMKRMKTIMKKWLTTGDPIRFAVLTLLMSSLLHAID